MNFAVELLTVFCPCGWQLERPTGVFTDAVAVECPHCHRMMRAQFWRDQAGQVPKWLQGIL